jgi:hypothetical protein
MKTYRWFFIHHATYLLFSPINEEKKERKKEDYINLSIWKILFILFQDS